MRGSATQGLPMTWSLKNRRRGCAPFEPGTLHTARGPRPAGAAPGEFDESLLGDTQTYLRQLALGCAPVSSARDAWECFFQLYDPLVQRTVRAVGLRGADTRDCMQEAWMEILRRLPNFHYDPCCGRFSGWIYTLARNKAIDFRRRLIRSTKASVIGLETLVACPAPDRAGVHEQDATGQLLCRVLSILRPRISSTNFRMVRLRWVEGRSVSETAAALQLSPEQIRYRTYRLKKRLQPAFFVDTRGAARGPGDVALRRDAEKCVLSAPQASDGGRS
jgi:RNA polymerase sigma-70 factor, ECF subfamily